MVDVSQRCTVDKMESGICIYLYIHRYVCVCVYTYILYGEREGIFAYGWEMQEKIASIWNQLFSMIDESLVSKELNRWKEGCIKRTTHLILIKYTYTWKSFCQTSWIAQDLMDESSQELSVKNASLHEEQRDCVKRNGGKSPLDRHLEWTV